VKIMWFEMTVNISFSPLRNSSSTITQFRVFHIVNTRSSSLAQGKVHVHRKTKNPMT